MTSGVAERFYSAFAARDWRTMGSLYADDARFSDPAFVDLDAREARAMWRMLITRGTDLTLQYQVLAESADAASVRWVTSTAGRGRRSACRGCSSAGHPSSGAPCRARRAPGFASSCNDSIRTNRDEHQDRNQRRRGPHRDRAPGEEERHHGGHVPADGRRHRRRARGPVRAGDPDPRPAGHLHGRQRSRGLHEESAGGHGCARWATRRSRWWPR